MRPAIPRPDPSEYPLYYETYVAKVPDGDVLALLAEQRLETQALLVGITEGNALHRYAPGSGASRKS